jgi:hypothetical protein
MVFITNNIKTRSQWNDKLSIQKNGLTFKKYKNNFLIELNIHRHTHALASDSTPQFQPENQYDKI